MVTHAYVHVPFCKSICAYCDFFRNGYVDALQDRWLKEIIKDIQQKDFSQVETLYVGGGTPTCIGDEQFELLLQTLTKQKRGFSEFTVEANVESFTQKKIDLCVQYGVNRISLGVQSMDDVVLKRLNRKHSVQDIKETIHALKKAGITNISVDLIYGLPDQTFDLWKETLSQVMQLQVPHISLYALTIEENSQFGREQVEPMNSELEADLYEYAISYLEANGYEHYEISNFALPTYSSKHNLGYWKYEDFYGIGCGASGKENHIRYENECHMYHYLNGERNREEVVLSPKEEQFEYLMMGFRVKDGISKQAFMKRFGISFDEKYANKVKRLKEKGWLVLDGDTVKTSKDGMFLLHEVLIELMDEG